MADIRVERKGGASKVWLWVLLAVIALVAVVVLLDYLGYIELPIQMGALDAQVVPAAWLAFVPAAQRKEI